MICLTSRLVVRFVLEYAFYLLFKNFFFFPFYLFEREGDHAHAGGGGEGGRVVGGGEERERISQAGFRLSAEPDMGLIPQPRDHDLS